MTAAAPLRYECHIAVGAPGEARLLLLPGEAGWRLPGFGADERHFWQDVDHVNAWLRFEFGAPATTLRCLSLDYSPGDELVSMVYAAALHDSAWSPPPGARWVFADELPGLALEREGQRETMAEWLAWYAGGPPPRLRAPWYLPGWHAEAAAWAATALRQAGLPPRGPIEQLRSWQRSAILRLPTAEGPAYFKAVPPMFGHEPALTAALAAGDPPRFAAPVAIDEGRGWLLMRELPGPSLEALRDDGDVPRWQAALASFAEVQIATATRLDELRALGVPDRPLEALAGRLAPMLADTAATLPGRPAGLSAEERARLRALAPRTEIMAQDLAAYGLPTALEHGDFWAGQVVVGERGFGFLDWSDSSLAHPFFSLLLFLVEIEDFFPRVPWVRERLRDAYLEPWRPLAPGADLTRAFELAQPLAALHHALTYHTVVLPNIEVKWEMELMLPFYLKMALRLAA
jgi:hypothetical protein